MEKIEVNNSNIDILYLHGNERNGLKEKKVFEKFKIGISMYFPNSPFSLIDDNTNIDDENKHFYWDKEEIYYEYITKIILEMKNKVILCGFSRGGRLILKMLYENKMPDNIIGIITYAPGKFNDIEYWNFNGKIDIPVYIIVGKDDEISYHGSTIVTRTLKKNNVNVTLLKLTNIGHIYPNNYEDLFNNAIKYISKTIPKRNKVSKG